MKPTILTAPGSKSLTQRALVVAALADGPVTVEGALVCDDSRHLTEVLVRLGVGVRWEGTRVRVTPGPLRGSEEAHACGNAGTTMRFSAALSLILDGPLVLDGNARMRERPIGPLGDALHALGVEVRYLGQPGFPPLRLERRAPPPAEVTVEAALSSQFASGLLLVAPRLPAPLTLRLAGAVVSRSYLTMTGALMERAGAKLAWLDARTVRVEPGSYRADALAPALGVEPDWSGAAFLLAAGELLGRPVEVPGLLPPEASLQGDAAFAGMIEELRRPRVHRFDLTDTPDLIAPLVALCPFAADATEIVGAGHTRVKECDRIAVLAEGLRRIGAGVEERPDGLTVRPLEAPRPGPIELDPHEDHRMAMTFGLWARRVPGLRVLDPGCVSKSFPLFWEELARFDPSTGQGAGA